MENGIVKPMVRSLLISYVLSGILLAALAFALYKLHLKEGQVNLMVFAVYFVTCLAGGLLAQYQGSATIDMGRGAIVIGLAAVIIGEVLLDKVFRNFALKLLSAVIGAIIYYVVITVVLRLGLESTDLKLLTALVVAVFLAVPYWKGRYFTKPVRKEGAPHA